MLTFFLRSLAFFLFIGPAFANERAFEELLKQRVRESGWKTSQSMYFNPDEKLSSSGKRIFESEKLSLNGHISCLTCHQAKFGSGDGIPNAAAIGYHKALFSEGGSKIIGPERLLKQAKQLPRNTLPLFGRGAVGFDAFFWDGRIDFTGPTPISPFGTKSPSKDNLVTAVHLPPVEIREMLDEDAFVVANKRESVEVANKVFDAISVNLRRGEPEASREISSVLNKRVEDLTFLDFSRAMAAHIRSEFRIKETRLEQFMLGKGKLTPSEIRGGLLFYGKGGCVACHSGPHFSDFKFHSIGFPQVGFGKNGFGVDYGRYNATFNPNDLYKFRTAPLYNVANTAPYGHSGSIATLEQAIVAHFDPLRTLDTTKLTSYERHEFYRRLANSAPSVNRIKFLNDEEVELVVRFLRTLSF